MTIGAPGVRGVTRAYGQATVLQYRGQALVAAAGAAVTPYLAGTATPYPAPLYATAEATAPLTFPVLTGADGVVALWGDAPARLDVVASAPGLGQAAVTLDLELPPDAAGLDAYTKTESDLRYPLKTDPNPYPGYLTPAEGDARYAAVGAVPDVAVTTDASLTATESPANTFALAARLSPDAGNALALRANGLFGTDTAGGGLATDPLADAKGDLFAAAGADAVGRLPLGPNGQVLTADSAQALGVKWAAAAGGAFVDEAGDVMTGALVLQGAATGTNVLQAKVPADTQPRFRADASGKLEWGAGGAVAPTIALSRTGTAELTLNAHLVPATNNSVNLGGASQRWKELNVVELIASADTAYLQVGATSPANAGAVRLRNAAALTWRNAGNSANLTLAMDASDRPALAVGAGAVTATATTGAAGAPPAQAAAYLTVVVNGTAYKLPLYLP